VALLPAFSGTKSGETLLAARILISGRTNVNQFELNYAASQSGTDPSGFKFSVRNDSLSGSFLIPVASFTSRPEKVRDDFLILTNAARNPYITIKLIQGVPLPVSQHYADLPVSIKMAGTSKDYHINCLLKRIDHEHLLLEGNQTVRLSDYGIDPPVKMVGLIRVEDELNINFSIIFTVSE